MAVRRDDVATFRKDPARSIEKFIKSMVRESPENTLFLIDDSPIFDEPLVGFADGDDPLFSEFKSIIGPGHPTPREVLERTLESFSSARAHEIEHISVICWVLPISARTRESNAVQNEEPSERWAHTRNYGEQFNESLRIAVEALLADQGCVAVAPMLSSLWSRQRDDATGLNSNWSERHALYVAGMGTFGLSGGLITPRGMAVRCGSVVVDLKLPPSPREYQAHTDYCPFFTDGSCGACIVRCPAGAITAAGHDKKKCEDYCERVLGQLREEYGVEHTGCGLCQTRVPCESGIPRRTG